MPLKLSSLRYACQAMFFKLCSSSLYLHSMRLKQCSLSYVLETMLSRLIFPECFKAYLTEALCTDPQTDLLLESYALQIYALQAMLYKLCSTSYFCQAMLLKLRLSIFAHKAMLLKLISSSYALQTKHSKLCSIS